MRFYTNKKELEVSKKFPFSKNENKLLSNMKLRVERDYSVILQKFINDILIVNAHIGFVLIDFFSNVK